MDLNPHPPFEEEKDLFKILKDTPDEHQIIQLTGEAYDELITDRTWGTPLNGDTPWVILFVSSEDNIDQKRAYQNYRHLAKDYKGKVRFAWVSQPKEELLSATFNARHLPQTFLVKNGTAYWYRDFPYEKNMKEYIENEGYYKSTTSFAQPRRFYQIQLYLYTYPRKEFRVYYRKKLEFDFRQWLANNYPKVVFPNVEVVTNYVYWTAVWLIFAFQVITFLIIKRCCCGR